MSPHVGQPFEADAEKSQAGKPDIRLSFTLIELLVVIAIIAVLLALLSSGGGLDALAQLLVGWAIFLWRTLPQVRLSPAGVGTGIVCLLALGVGLHLFLRWLVGALPAPAEGQPRRWALRSTVAVLLAVVLAFTAGIATVGATHQVGWLLTSPEPLTSRSSLRQTAASFQSQNNLKEAVFACHKYADEKKNTFPPPALFDEQGQALHGFFTLLLPYVEQEALFARIDLNKPWNDSANAPAFRQTVRNYQHPLAPPEADGLPFAHYAFNARLVQGGRPLTMEEIQKGRGAANTLLLGEAAGNFKPWGHPIHWRDPGAGLNRSPDGFGNPAAHYGRPLPKPPTVAFAFADGSVRVFRDDADPDFLALLANPERK